MPHNGQKLRTQVPSRNFNGDRPGKTVESTATRGMPVSRSRVEACLRSAVLWTDELPRYANYQQSKADWWALTAGIVATITGLAIFPVISDTSSDLQRSFVALFAFAAGVCALVPRIKNYAEMAGQARELSAAYGPLVGQLMDGIAVIDANNGDRYQDQLREAVSAFEAAKAKKDTLRYLPRGRKLKDARTAAQVRVTDLLQE